MSDVDPQSQAQSRQPDRDRGMTLPELLIAVTIIGVIMAVLSSAIIVTLGQNANTEGRLNVARAEQSISLWVPADLSSADTVDTSPQATPCGLSVCDGIDLSNSSNVLMLSWQTESPDGTIHTTDVGYSFALADDGLSFELTRVTCESDGSGWSCSSFVVLTDLPGPPGGQAFVPGVAYGDACTRRGRSCRLHSPDLGDHRQRAAGSRRNGRDATRIGSRP